MKCLEAAVIVFLLVSSELVHSQNAPQSLDDIDSSVFDPKAADGKVLNNNNQAKWQSGGESKDDSRLGPFILENEDEGRNSEADIINQDYDSESSESEESEEASASVGEPGDTKKPKERLNVPVVPPAAPPASRKTYFPEPSGNGTVNKEPKHGMVVHQDRHPQQGQNIKEVVEEEQSTVDGDSEHRVKIERILITKGTYHGRRHRVDQSTTPSVQLIILVVGGVIACVLLTGFIRWRVRRRLLARKLRDIEFTVSTSGKVRRNRKATMDTIYECNEEGAVTSSSLDESPPDSPNTRRLFDGPIQSPKNKRADRLGCGHHLSSSRKEIKKSARVSVRSHSHRSRPPIHVPLLETISSNCLETSELGNEGGCSDEPLLEPPPPLLPPHLIPRQQHTSRGLVSSLLNSWRSLSFNRDWVGQLWQERHNIRRISDVVRGNLKQHDAETEDPTNSNELDSHEGSTSFVVDDDTENLPGQSPNIDPSVSNTAVSSCSDRDPSHVDPHLTPEIATHQVSDYTYLVDQNGNLTPCRNALEDVNCNRVSPGEGNAIVQEAEFLQATNLNSVRRIYPTTGTPPDYTSCPLDSPMLGGETSRHRERHQRYNRRRRTKQHYFKNSSDTRTEQNQHSDSSRTQGTAQNTQAHELSLSHNTYSATLPSVVMNDIPLARSPISVTSPVRRSEFEPHTEQNFGLTQCLNSPTNSSIEQRPRTGSFSRQEGVVLEQLSDGAQIIYVPPPALPSYHNDNPPPYQQ